MGLISTFNLIECLVASIWSHVFFFLLACVFVSFVFYSDSDSPYRDPWLLLSSPGPNNGTTRLSVAVFSDSRFGLFVIFLFLIF